MDSPASELPAELRAFIYSCIDSVEQTDLLVRLRRTGAPATVRQLASQTGTPPASVRRHVETLVVRGLLHADVSEEVQYRYAPETPQLRHYADLLDQYYSAQRDLVIRAISARAARAFADAFKLRKDDS